MGETRKLAAIMAVDVVGYSRLMGEDEAGTARAVREHRQAAIPIIAGRGGRIFKTMGDGLLVEFRSVIAAVECAVAIQKRMAARNADTPEAKRVVYRIGVNLGDVLIDGDDILGDGVNIAARLDRVCEPGGISISRARLRPDQWKARIQFSKPRPANTEKHHEAGRGIRNRLCGQNGRRPYARRRERGADHQILPSA